MQGDNENNELLPPKRSLDPMSTSENHNIEGDSPINIPPLRDTVAEAQSRRSMTRNRLGGIVIGFSIAAVMMGAAFWWGFELGRQAMDDAPLQIIRADTTPIKVPPQDPGGLQVPHQDKLVLKRKQVDTSQVTEKQGTIRSGPEEPLTPPVESKLPAHSRTDADAANKSPLSKTTDETGPMEQSAETAPTTAKKLPAEQVADEGKSSEMLERPVKSEASIKPEVSDLRKPPNSIITLKKTPVESGNTVKGTDASVKLVKKMDSPTQEVSLENTKVNQAQESSKKVAVVGDSVTPGNSDTTKIESAPAPSKKAYHVQLASYRNRDNAVSGWSVLKRRYDSLLGNLNSRIVEVNLPKKGVFYRLQAGPLPSAKAARLLCEKIIVQSQGCLVVTL